MEWNGLIILARMPCSVPEMCPSHLTRSLDGLTRCGFIKTAAVAGLLAVLLRAEILQIVRLRMFDPNWSHGFLIPLCSVADGGPHRDVR